MGNSCSAGFAGGVFDCDFLCCPFFPLAVLGGIWDLIESVSEGFLTYSRILNFKPCIMKFPQRACNLIISGVSE